MFRNQFKRSLLIIFVLSFISISLWLAEILFIKGWYGLNWINGELYAPYLITLVVVIAFLVPFAFKKQLTRRNGFVATILLYATSIFCYSAGGMIIYLPYRRFFWSASDFYFMCFIGFLLFPFLAVCYWFVVKKLITKTKKVNILYLLLLSLAVVPLSLLSITICSGFGTGDGLVDAIKMGYPAFWTTTMMGCAGIILAKE